MLYYKRSFCWEKYVGLPIRTSWKCLFPPKYFWHNYFLWIITLKQVSNQLHKTSHWLIVTSINNVQRGGQQLQSMYFSWFPSVWSPAFPDNCSFAQFFFFCEDYTTIHLSLKRLFANSRNPPSYMLHFSEYFAQSQG